MDSFYLTNFPVVFAENLTINLFSNETRNIYLYKYGSFLLFTYLVVEKMTKLCEILENMWPRPDVIFCGCSLDSFLQAEIFFFGCKYFAKRQAHYACA